MLYSTLSGRPGSRPWGPLQSLHRSGSPSSPAWPNRLGLGLVLVTVVLLQVGTGPASCWLQLRGLDHYLPCTRQPGRRFKLLGRLGRDGFKIKLRFEESIIIDLKFCGRVLLRRKPAMRSGKGPPLPVLALAASRIQHVFGSSCWIQSSYGNHYSLPDINNFSKFLLPLTGTNDLFIMLDQQSNFLISIDHLHLNQLRWSQVD